MTRPDPDTFIASADLRAFADELRDTARWEPMQIGPFVSCPECAAAVLADPKAMHRHGQWHVTHAREHGL